MTEHDRIEQLAALLDGDLDATDAPAGLGSLLTLADTVRGHADLITPTPEFRDALRRDLVAAAAVAPGPLARARAAWTVRTTGLRSSARVAVATMTASSMLGTAGVAVAAQESIPGDLLHGVKSLTEDARLLLADDDVAQARLHLEFARERLRELELGAGRLDIDQVVALLAAMDEHSQQGADALLQGVGGGAVDPDELRTFTRVQRDGLVALFQDLPLLARPVAEDSLELLRRIEVNATGIVGSDTTCDCDTPTQRDGTATGTTARSTTGTLRQPGAGPALTPFDCDCVELPGGIELRERRSTTSDGSGAGDGETTGSTADEGQDDQSQDDSPFVPSGSLADPRADDDTSDEKSDRTSLDASGSVDQLPLRETTAPLATAVEDTTGTESDLDGAVDRAQDGVDGLLD